MAALLHLAQELRKSFTSDLNLIDLSTILIYIENYAKREAQQTVEKSVAANASETRKNAPQDTRPPPQQQQQKQQQQQQQKQQQQQQQKLQGQGGEKTPTYASIVKKAPKPEK